MRYAYSAVTINGSITNPGDRRKRIRENIEKVKLNKQLPYLVGNVVEVLEPDAEDGLANDDEEDGGATDVNAERKTRSAVIRTSTVRRSTFRSPA